MNTLIGHKPLKPKSDVAVISNPSMQLSMSKNGDISH